MIERDKEVEFTRHEVERELAVEALVSLVENYIPTLPLKMAFNVRPAQQCPAVLKEACKRLRKRHPELKVKRVKECGESFIRLSPKKD
jgi:hypothetical protein